MFVVGELSPTLQEVNTILNIVQGLGIGYFAAKFSATQRNGGVRVKPTELPPTFAEQQRINSTNPETVETVGKDPRFPVVDPVSKNPGT